MIVKDNNSNSIQALENLGARGKAVSKLLMIENGIKIDKVIHEELSLSDKDYRLFSELVYGCTRQKLFLDYRIQELCHTSTRQLPMEVLIILRMGVYQLLFLNKIPNYAIISEAVQLSKKTKFYKLSGLVNAILRKIAIKKKMEIKIEDPVERLSIQFSHPKNLIERWRRQFPLEKLEKILQGDNLPHSIFLKIKPDQRERVQLDLKSFEWKLVENLPDTLEIQMGRNKLFQTQSFLNGDWFVQDWTPQTMLSIAPIQEGQQIWDVCASPGSKSLWMAITAGRDGKVLATDNSNEKLLKISESVQRMGLNNIEYFNGEISRLPKPRRFDLIWVDAPCSGTGVLSRRADLRWKWSVENLKNHQKKQSEILEIIEPHCYGGGWIVYSTCSLEPEENEQVISNFLDQFPTYEIINPASNNIPDIEVMKSGTYFLPTENHDGGFLSILKKKVLV